MSRSFKCDGCGEFIKGDSLYRYEQSYVANDYASVPVFAQTFILSFSFKNIKDNSDPEFCNTCVAKHIKMAIAAWEK